MNAMNLLPKINASPNAESINIERFKNKFEAAMLDDFNSPVLIAELFEAVKLINSIYDEKLTISAEDLNALGSLMETFVYQVLGLKEEDAIAAEDFQSVMEILIELRNRAKNEKNYVVSDHIRNQLQKIGIDLKDSKANTIWTKN